MDEAKLSAYRLLRVVCRNLTWGLKWGLSVATGYCVIAFLIFVVSGPDPFERLDTSLLGVLAFYIILGTVAGIMLGFLRPFVYTAVGAIIVGIIVAFPVVAVGFLLVGGSRPWGTYETVVLILLSIIFGTAGGLGEWSRHEEKLSGAKKRPARRGR